MTRLSVNINKIATLRNSRGGNNPDVVKAAADCLRFGADGITVHPRPDERHIRYSDVREISSMISLAPAATTAGRSKAEFNIEGNPKEDKFVSLVLEVKPHQVTLVPDDPGQLTSNHGWHTIAEREYLREVIAVFKNAGIRVSIFVDPVEQMVAAAADTGTDRVELYTEAYARNYPYNKEAAVADFVKAAAVAAEKGLGLNAGHDLDMDNLAFFRQSLPGLLEVSIGHALISDALYFGLENVIQLYKRKL